MNEMTEADRYDGRSRNVVPHSPITYSPVKGVWYDTESFGNADQELADMLEHAE